jgi:putative ribosome biogenesis GTPase RsgA
LIFSERRLSSAAVAAGRGVFVGRAAELAVLEEAAAAARGGQPTVVLVEGETGIGKSTLLARFASGLAGAAVLRASGLRGGAHRFAHAAEHALGQDQVLLDSYHCSRYNTQTRRLTTAMFEAVVGRARELMLAARP